MKKLKLLTIILSLFASSILFAGTGDGWLTNFDKASAEASEKDKTILLQFHGSDWCPPCIKMGKEVLSSDDFKSYAKENLVLVDLDFPRRKSLAPEQKKHNYKLQDQYGIRGYPTFILVDANGTEIDRIVGYTALDEFMSFLNDNS